MTLLNRSGLAAIAAATAFLSTPAMAQEAAPVTSNPAPIVADEPIPVETIPAPAAETVSDPLAPATTTTTTTTRTTRTARPTRANSAPSARSVRAPAPGVAAPTAIAPAAPAAPVATVDQAAPPFDPAMVAPLPEPVVAAPVAADTSTTLEDALPIAGAAGLGLLALAGAGYAMRRRRREDDVEVEEIWHEPVLTRAEPVPAATTPILAANPPISAATAPITVAARLIAKSAFDWGNAPRETAPSMSRIEAARRGPTPDNPSQSLKKRLQRAAFFDNRERAVAAGKAEPMSPMAGLPDALVNSPAQPERRAEDATRMSFGRSFQPA